MTGPSFLRDLTLHRLTGRYFDHKARRHHPGGTRRDGYSSYGALNPMTRLGWVGGGVICRKALNISSSCSSYWPSF